MWDTFLARLLTLEGFNVTQATVSRDIKELGLVKEKGRVLNFRYALPDNTFAGNDKIIPLLKTFITSVVKVNNLIVVKTLEGHGSACGMAIDRLTLSGVLGSVAGDDTLLIITESDELAEIVEHTLKGYIGL